MRVCHTHAEIMVCVRKLWMVSNANVAEIMMELRALVGICYNFLRENGCTLHIPTLDIYAVCMR